MRTGGVPIAALLLVLSITVLQVSAAGDIYWEGEEDASNEFLEVKQDDSNIVDHLKRFKRDWLSSFFGGNEDKPDEEKETTGGEVGASALFNNNDDQDNYGSGYVDRSLDSPEPKEKTLRVTFTVVEPYRTEYSNRDSQEFLDFSHSLASAVDQLFEKLPGTQKTSLVRIQSLIQDEFSCKVTLDIVTTGYDDTDTIAELLMNHIKNNNRLGKTTVTMSGFNAQPINPATTFDCEPDKFLCDEDLCLPMSSVCDSRPDCNDGSDERNCPATGSDTGYPPENNNPDQNQGTGSSDDIYNSGGYNVPTSANPEPENPNPNPPELDNPNYDPYNVNQNGAAPQPDNRNGYEAPTTRNYYQTNEIGNNQPDDYYGQRPDDQDNQVDYEPSRGDGGRLSETDFNGEPLSTDDDQGTYSSEPVPSNPEFPTPTTVAPNACPSGTMRCDETRCVDNAQRCDGFRDCYDGADEADCPPGQCSRDDFQCNNGNCIESSRRCDGVHDCPDHEDEQGCDCRDDEFRCESDGICIEDRKRCDGVAHCSDSSDERDCPCGPDQWQCDHGSCIKRKFRCNGRVDCPTDRSDERNCLASGSFRCRTGKFIPEYLRCNRKYDCPPGDFSDEQNCPCGASDFKCDNGHCIPASKRCDRTHDCQDRSDERHCTYGTICMASEYKCKSGMCVPAEARCNGTVECNDDSDELGCSCKRDQYKCRDGTCINVAFLCNGHEDCANGEDEYNCKSMCPADQFTCLGGSNPCAIQCNGQAECEGGEDEQDCDPYGQACALRCDGKCIQDDKICDRHSDCSDGSDESECDYCNGSDDFSCESGDCIPLTQRCNGIPECPDSSDEKNCNDTMITNNQPCDSNQFTCLSDQLCIDIQYHCDGNRDCNDGSDESNCPCPMADSWQCRDGQCIPSAGYCDNIPDCDDRSDESDCHYTTQRTYVLPTTNRLPSARRTERPRLPLGGGGNRYPSYSGYPGNQDSDYQTPDPRGSANGDLGGAYVPASNPSDPWNSGRGSTGVTGEKGLPGYGGSGYLPTDSQDTSSRSNTTSYPGGDNQSGNQDGWNAYGGQPGQPGDRGRGSDYSGWGRGDGNGVCRDYQWRCENGPCIDAYRRCDGHIDCPFDFSDEFDCPPNSPITLKLMTYPSAQTIRYGGDVVFQCRDEGPLRAKVKWYKDRGQIKDGSTDVRGRLEMFQVTTADSGVYICRAVDYASSPGGEARVTLQVENAPVTAPPYIPCNPYEATCANGQCIPKSSVCNGKVDCSDGSDEDNCHHNGLCQPNEFKCENRKCILKTWICDGQDDCGDNSDEQNCVSNAPNGQCSAVEFSCKSGNQCILKSFLCDGVHDCFDGSDEMSCNIMYITSPPKPANVNLQAGQTLVLTAVATGFPVPLISWRRNWGHVPAKCTWTNDNGVGVLTCVDMQPEDSGAYSAEAINNRGALFAVPDAIVIVTRQDICPQGYFNSEARSESECIRCFCFGKSTQCRSADLYTHNMPTPLGEGGTRLIGIKASRSNDVNIDTQPISSQYFYQPLRNGATVTKSGDVSSWSNAHPYLTLPEMYNGNQLKSYGGHIKYTLSPQTQLYGYDDAAATIIIKGKYGNLFHVNRNGGARIINVEARLIPEDWSKYPDGSEPASREHIMMVLDDIEMILLRADLNGAGVNITDFTMESAEHLNAGLGVASLVEECTCPKGYEGLSCQKCASGFVRKKVGPWLGNCEREECPAGTYGDPASGMACKPCPCPLTNRQNQFARTCSLGPDGSVICDCYPGYQGQHCEACAEGYEGNPLLPGNTCQRKKDDNCNPIGTKSIRPPDECVCKDNVHGRYCDQCKNDSFFLSQDFRHGCALCFCSGVSQQCMSSTYRRKTTSVQFNTPQSVDQLKIYSSAPAGLSGSVRYSAPKQTDLKPQLDRGDISINDDFNSRNSIYYWSLPASFAGDKVTSYGGFLRYTLKNVPSSVDPRYRNTAPDIQLISINQLTFHYFVDFSGSHDRILNASIQFLEKGWQRQDGKEVTREHFLLALADVKTILVKASYAPGQIATPLSASIETAEPDAYGPIADHVEQCRCPPGYEGTSCEDCKPGYTRSSTGLYLEHCEPCECNGKSQMCHPETGVCYNCADNTDGDQCESCKPGYDRDPYGNCIEVDSQATTRPCYCDPRGSSGPCDSNGNCVCKQNVEGDSCDRCRPGTFGLDESNPEGCLACYCSGVTSECHEGSHYTRMQIAAPVLFEDYNGFTITDVNAERVIKDNFTPLFDQSELMYNIQFVPDIELYWSLPVLPANRVLSYGGSIYLRQKFSSSDESLSDRGTDVILDGGDISIYWTNPKQFESGVSYTYQVPLREEGWFILNTPTPASRIDFMNVLRNLKRVLVRATLARGIYETTIADVSIDTAIQSSDPNLPVAKGIEICMCPPGYIGTSCENCKPDYYKDQYGTCRPCPCNGHNCQLDNSGQVICNCLPPYTGYDCSTIGLIMELHPTIHEAVGDNINLRRVTFTCKYRAPEPLTIKFYHDGLEQKPSKYYNESRLEKDGWHGEHVWHTVWDTRYQGEIYECHTFTERGFTLGVLTTSLPEPGGESSMTEPPPRPPLQESTVSVTIISPTIKIAEIGQSVNFTCQAQSRNTRNRPKVRWTKSDGELPLGRTYIDENYGLIQITNLQVSDSGVYICESSDGINTAQATATLKVPGNDMIQPSVEIYPSVMEYYEGDRIELECRVKGNPLPAVSWRRSSGRPLPLNFESQGYRFIIESARTEDTGEYRCIASNTVGSDDRTAMITIRPRPIEPPREKLTVSNTSPTIEEGHSIRIVCTGTTNVPAGSIDWVRQDNAVFLSNVRSENGVLYIDYARPDNQGVYICQSPRLDIDSIPILVTVVAANPIPEAYNISVSVDRLKLPTGGSGTVDCNPVGRPLPLIRWSKHDGNFGPQSSQRGNTLIINNAQESDGGYYVCEGSINGNIVANIYVYVDIEKREPPKVEIWPPGEQAVQLGGQHELICRVLGGIPSPDITWNRNGRPLSSSTQIQPHNVLKFNMVDVNDEGEYTCTAHNDAGTVSASAVIKVHSPPVITITPNNYLEFEEGQPITVECRANGYPEPMVSISQMGGYELVSAQAGHVTFYKSSATTSDTGYYTCTAQSDAGSITEQFAVDVSPRGERTSRPPIFNEEGSGDDGTDDRPPINDTPDIYVLQGLDARLECSEQGRPSQVRWYQGDNMELPRNAYQNGTELIIRNADKSHSGLYQCNVLDSSGSILAAAYTSLVVVAPPTITLLPASQTVQPGQSPTVECRVTGDDILDTQWRPFGREAPSRMEVSGNKLIFNNIEVEDAGKYECIARSRYANRSAIAEVIVSEGSDQTWVSHDNEQWTHAGAAVHLSCNLTKPNTRIEWTKDGRPLPRSVTIKSDGSLFLRLARKSDTGRYVCSVRDAYGRILNSNYIDLHIQGYECLETEFRCYDDSNCVDEHLLCDGYRDCQDNSDEENCLWRDKRFSDTIKESLAHDGPRYEEKPQLLYIEQPAGSFRAGDNVNVLCRTRLRDVKVQWVRPGTNQYVNSLTYGDGAMLEIQRVTIADAGIYRCVGTDMRGRRSEDEFELRVESGSGIPSYPDRTNGDDYQVAEYTANLRDGIELPCRYNLEPPVTIEWSREYLPLPPGLTPNQPILRFDSVTEKDAGTYTCRVSNSRTTVQDTAILVVRGVVPKFDGNGFISLPTLRDAFRQFEIEISFKPMDENGLLLYNSQNQGRTGDYIALQLESGVPEFIMNTGPEEITKVAADRPLQLNVWHTIRISRTGTKVTMDVDNKGPFFGELPGQWAVLELNQPLYIGGVPDIEQLPSDLAGASGLIGCVSMLVLGREEKNIMMDSLEAQGISECNTCIPNNCQNNGFCQEYLNERGYICNCAPGFAGVNCDHTGEACRPGICGPGKCTDTDSGYKCACPVSHTGRNCEAKQSIEYPAFTGSAFMAIKAPVPSRTLKMSVNIKAASPVTDGIIIYCAESSRGYGGFISLAVHNGKLEFRLDFGGGSQPIVLTSNRTLPAGEWTDVHIARIGSMVSLKINSVYSYEQRLPEPYNQKVLPLETAIYVGGVDESIILNKNTGVTEGFNGCIKEITLHGQPVNIVNQIIESANVQECQFSPVTRGDIPDGESMICQCRNGGQCTSPSDPTSCACPAGFTGQFCEQRASYPMTDPCASRPCLNGGTCRRSYSQTEHSCDCPLGYEGTYCERSFTPRMSVGFSGNGYIQLPSSQLTYDNLEAEPALIAMSFYTTSEDGVLLYQHELETQPNYGDYIILRIEGGIVVMDWNLGGGHSTVQVSGVYVNDGERHSIIATLLMDGRVDLSVDNQRVDGTSTGVANTMNANSNIYIGGMPDGFNTQGYRGFNGCIEQIELMNSNRGINLANLIVTSKNAQSCTDYREYQ